MTWRVPRPKERQLLWNKSRRLAQSPNAILSRNGKLQNDTSDQVCHPFSIQVVPATHLPRFSQVRAKEIPRELELIALQQLAGMQDPVAALFRGGGPQRAQTAAHVTVMCGEAGALP